jgi:hypothetical protein
MSAPGSVAATREIWEQLSSTFAGEPLGEIEVKGKGTMPVFGIRHKASEPAREPAGPSAPA